MAGGTRPRPAEILVVGATGTVGGATVARLRTAGRLVRALVRSAARGADLAAIGAELAVGDLEQPATLDAALVGVERALLVSPLDPRQVALQGNFVEAACRAGSVHVVKLSGLGTGLDSLVSSGRWHAETERRIEASGLPYTFLRPPFFMQNIPNHYGRAAATEGVLAAPLGQARIAMVDAGDVAGVAAAVLTGPGHAGRTYTPTGPAALSMDDVAAILSAVLGRSVIYRDVPVDALRRELSGEGLPPWRVDLATQFWHAIREGGAAPVTDAVLTTTGHPPRSFEAFARGQALHFLRCGVKPC